MLAVDVWQDFANGASLQHMTSEVVMISLGAMALGALWMSASTRAAYLATSLDHTREDLRAWREKARLYSEGLSGEIDRQFDIWGLSPAEKEIALLMLKGLSFKESAQIRNASERTVRQQAQDVYRKANVAGRNEFAAWFLEELLVPRS
ncbi:transcriptional regulator [bacterium]|nr:transcriptional regulator [bacterium]